MDGRSVGAEHPSILARRVGDAANYSSIGRKFSYPWLHQCQVRPVPAVEWQVHDPLVVHHLANAELAGVELLDAGGGVVVVDSPAPPLLPHAAVTMATAAAIAATAVHLPLRIRTPIEMGRPDRGRGVRRAPQPWRGMAGRDGCAERSRPDYRGQVRVTDLAHRMGLKTHSRVSQIEAMRIVPPKAAARYLSALATFPNVEVAA